MNRLPVWTVCLALGAGTVTAPLAAANDPGVGKTDNGVFLKGRTTTKTDRSKSLMGDGRPGKPGKKKSGGKADKANATKAEPPVDRFPGVVAEPASCVVIGNTESEASLVARGCVDPQLSAVVRPLAPNRPRVEQITAETVRTELKFVNFPALTVQIQPTTRTLVNLKTIVYTKPVPVDQIVPVLTWPVGVRASVGKYTWNFGDGTTETTSSPGAPYPALDVVHQYKKRGKVAVSVTAHYIARYRVPGGSWTTLPGTVDIAGPPTALTVAEARPVLVDPGR